jgi:hypothetical protein
VLDFKPLIIYTCIKASSVLYKKCFAGVNYMLLNYMIYLLSSVFKTALGYVAGNRGDNNKIE